MSRAKAHFLSLYGTALVCFFIDLCLPICLLAYVCVCVCVCVSISPLLCLWILLLLLHLNVMMVILKDWFKFLRRRPIVIISKNQNSKTRRLKKSFALEYLTIINLKSCFLLCFLAHRVSWPTIYWKRKWPGVWVIMAKEFPWRDLMTWWTNW